MIMLFYTTSCRMPIFFWRCPLPTVKITRRQSWFDHFLPWIILQWHLFQEINVSIYILCNFFIYILTMNHSMENLCTNLLSPCMCNRDSVHYMLLAVYEANILLNSIGDVHCIFSCGGITGLWSQYIVLLCITLCNWCCYTLQQIGPASNK